MHGFAGIKIKCLREYMNNIIAFIGERKNLAQLLPLQINTPELIWIMRRRFLKNS
jgi:hypothetical protein